MKVILLENIRKIGSIGDIIDVKRGFARNFLISKKKALFASKQNIKDVENLKKDLNKKDLERKKEAKEIAEKIQNKTYETFKLCTENKELYGSVKPTEISEIIFNKENIKLNSSIIQPIKEIKALGKHSVTVNLHSEIQTKIYINVNSQEKEK